MRERDAGEPQSPPLRLPFASPSPPLRLHFASTSPPLRCPSAAPSPPLGNPAASARRPSRRAQPVQRFRRRRRRQRRRGEPQKAGSVGHSHSLGCGAPGGGGAGAGGDESVTVWTGGRCTRYTRTCAHASEGGSVIRAPSPDALLVSTSFRSSAAASFASPCSRRPLLGLYLLYDYYRPPDDALSPLITHSSSRALSE
jgi:hypothetical protein